MTHARLAEIEAALAEAKEPWRTFGLELACALREEMQTVKALEEVGEYVPPAPQDWRQPPL